MKQGGIGSGFGYNLVEMVVSTYHQEGEKWAEMGTRR